MATGFPLIQIPSPIVLSVAEAKKWFALWASLPNYANQEVAILELYGPKSPYRANNILTNTQIKVSVLNDFYSTNIKPSFLMAEHIAQIPDCDKKLANGEISVVDDIRHLTIIKADGTSEKKDCYSFATKYCCLHQLDKFPIYDSLVEQMIVYLSNYTSIPFTFRYINQLKKYEVFKEQIDIIINYFNLHSLTYREVDRYLWLIGKRYFSKPSTIFPQPNYNKFNVKP